MGSSCGLCKKEKKKNKNKKRVNRQTEKSWRVRRGLRLETGREARWKFSK